MRKCSPECSLLTSLHLGLLVTNRLVMREGEREGERGGRPVFSLAKLRATAKPKISKLNLVKCPGQARVHKQGCG